MLYVHLFIHLLIILYTIFAISHHLTDTQIFDISIIRTRVEFFGIPLVIDLVM